MPGLPEQQAKVATLVVPDLAPYRVDLLFVIDDSPAMQPNEAALARAMWSAGFELARSDVDLHVAVITSDLGDERDVAHVPMPGECGGWGDAAALRRSVLVNGSYIRYRDVRGELRTNVTGTVGDALAALGSVGASGCTRARPLEAMRIALDHNPHDGGFLRDNAQLAVMIVAAQDDDSPRSLDDYVAFLKQLRPNVAVVVEGGTPFAGECGELPTNRLHDFVQQFPNRGSFSSICGLAGGFAVLGLDYFLPGWGPLIGNPCFDEPLADIAPAPGVQPDCTVTEYVDRGRPDEQQRLMAACGTGALPCWRIVEDPQCATLQHLRLDIDRGGEDPPDNDVVEAQCVSS